MNKNPVRFLLSAVLAAVLSLPVLGIAFAHPANAQKLMLSCSVSSGSQRMDSIIVVRPDQGYFSVDTGTGAWQLRLRELSEARIAAYSTTSFPSVEIIIDRMSGNIHEILGLEGHYSDWYGSCRAVSKPIF